MRLFRLSFRPALLAAALLGVGALGGCGVKGALEPPPGAALDPALAGSATVPAGTVGATLGAPQKPTEGPGAGASSRPVLEAPAAGRSNPLDWLIN